MLGRIIRVLIGFALACLAAGVVKVGFVMTPAELSSLPTDVVADRLGKAGELAVRVATHHAVFSAPFALFATVMGEWLNVRSWIYYALAGMAIALIGFLSQYSSEAASQPSIVNNYALTAFLTAGFVAGLVYWMVAGRSAGTAVVGPARGSAGPRPMVATTHRR